MAYSRLLRAGCLAGWLILVVWATAHHNTSPTVADSPTFMGAYLPTLFRPFDPPDTLILHPLITNLGTTTITDITHAGDERLFIVEREGYIRIWQDDALLPIPFLDVHDLISLDNWEEGLLSLAFHPDYAQNGYFFITYTTGDPDCSYDPDTDVGYSCYLKVARYQVSASDANLANPASATLLLSIPKSDKVHNGGDLSFGPDGYLYIPTGDGGPDPLPPGWENRTPGDLYNHGQRKNDRLGSLLRIDVDQSGGLSPDCTLGAENPPYTVPADNPFANGSGGSCDEIWAIGLRNPWRVSFDRQTGDLYIADVGEWHYEEINFQAAGAAGGVNYGWHCYEGWLDYTLEWPEVSDDCEAVTHTPPVYAYATDAVAECSITGGFVYRGQTIPGLRGHYVFADFCSGKVWRLHLNGSAWQAVQVADHQEFISTFGEDVHGELYVGIFGGGAVYQIIAP